MNWKKFSKGFLLFWVFSFIAAGIIGIISGLLNAFFGIDLFDNIISSSILNLTSASVGLVAAFFYTKT